MLAEFFDRIVGLGSRASEATVIRDSALPRTLIISKGERIEFRRADTPLRIVTLDSFEDVLALVENEDLAPNPEVYFSESSIWVVLNSEDMRECAILDLRESRRFQTIRALESEPRSFTPKEAVKFIRYELHGVNADSIVAALGRVDFTRRSEGRNHVEHGKESLGRSVEAQVQQADKVPDTFEVTVPVFTNSGVRHTAIVRCGLYLDLEAERVEIRVLTDEVQFALDTTMGRIRSTLEELTCPVFNGAPSWKFGAV
ncbi:MAG: hypothetical protein DHS20C21_03020 [Gemmatimonadota bacterium]|nr:MAG: hypothetical protein DHS20C21_03020 [Gemmatimonadota bacterium]